jgi:hypothetical protein
MEQFKKNIFSPRQNHLLTMTLIIKREEVVKMKSNFHLQKKDKDVKKRHKLIVHPDAAEKPYGWAFNNFYDAREHIKALGKKTRDTTSIGGEEFKPFDNLTTRWIKTSKLGQLLWVICIDNDGEKNPHWKLKKSMQIKLHAD